MIYLFHHPGKLHLWMTKESNLAAQSGRGLRPDASTSWPCHPRESSGGGRNRTLRANRRRGYNPARLHNGLHPRKNWKWFFREEADPAADGAHPQDRFGGPLCPAPKGRTAVKLGRPTDYSLVIKGPSPMPESRHQGMVTCSQSALHGHPDEGASVWESGRGFPPHTGYAFGLGRKPSTQTRETPRCATLLCPRHRPDQNRKAPPIQKGTCLIWRCSELNRGPEAPLPKVVHMLGLLLISPQQSVAGELSPQLTPIQSRSGRETRGPHSSLNQLA